MSATARYRQNPVRNAISLASKPLFKGHRCLGCHNHTKPPCLGIIVVGNVMRARPSAITGFDRYAFRIAKGVTNPIPTSSQHVKTATRQGPGFTRLRATRSVLRAMNRMPSRCKVETSA